MAEQHTKGPWVVHGQNIIGYLEIDIAIAKVFSNVGQPSKANAALIAAAPELAAFVGKIIQWKTGDSIEALQEEARELYRAAIAKAS